MAHGNTSLVGCSFSGAGVKAFLVLPFGIGVRLRWCCVSFLPWALPHVPHGSKSQDCVSVELLALVP